MSQQKCEKKSIKYFLIHAWIMHLISDSIFATVDLPEIDRIIYPTTFSAPILVKERQNLFSGVFLTFFQILLTLKSLNWRSNVTLGMSYPLAESYEVQTKDKMDSQLMALRTIIISKNKNLYYKHVIYT